MSADLAALLMGLAAILVFTGYRIRRKIRKKREKEILLAEFVPRGEKK